MAPDCRWAVQVNDELRMGKGKIGRCCVRSKEWPFSPALQCIAWTFSMHVLLCSSRASKAPQRANHPVFAGAQCAHAAVGLVEKLMHSRDAARVVLRQWETSGQAKVCLRAQDTQQLVSRSSASGS